MSQRLNLGFFSPSLFKLTSIRTNSVKSKQSSLCEDNDDDDDDEEPGDIMNEDL
jgi:hypothetical protein